MALSLPTFPAWLWKNPNTDPAIDSTSNPTPTTPIPNPNPNPNTQYLTLSSQEPQHAMLDGEAAHPYQWISPNPSPNPNPGSNPLYNHSHSHKSGGEGMKKNLYGAWGHNYEEFQAYNRPQTQQVSYPQRRRRRRRQTIYRPRRIPSFDLGLGLDLDLDLDFDLDRELDLVLVRSPPASDHNWSSAESEGSDWSVGWFEPHAPEFCNSKRGGRNYGGDADGDDDDDDDELENSFAVLVPCYRPSRAPSDIPSHLDSESKSQLWAAVLSNIANDPHPGTNHYLQQWLSSLQA